MLSFLQPIELVEKNKMATCLIDIITDPVLCKLRFPMCRPSRSLHLRSTAPNTPFTQGSLKNSNAYTLCQGCRTLQLHRTKVPTRADRVVRPYGWCGGCGVPRRHALRVVRWMRCAEASRPTGSAVDAACRVATPYGAVHSGTAPAGDDASSPPIFEKEPKKEPPA